MRRKIEWIPLPQPLLILARADLADSNLWQTPQGQQFWQILGDIVDQAEEHGTVTDAQLRTVENITGYNARFRKSPSPPAPPSVAPLKSEPEWLIVPDAATRLGVSVTWIHKQVREGVVEARSRGRAREVNWASTQKALARYRKHRRRRVTTERLPRWWQFWRY